MGTSASLHDCIDPPAAAAVFPACAPALICFLTLLTCRVLRVRLKAKGDLCLEGTNWRIGTSDVNVLVLALVTEKFRLP